MTDVIESEAGTEARVLFTVFSFDAPPLPGELKTEGVASRFVIAVDFKVRSIAISILL